MKNVGFIGVGYMGYGIAKNILKNNNKLFQLFTLFLNEVLFEL